MKKVLILNSCVNGGGAGRSLENYLAHKSDNIEAHVVVPERGIMGDVFEKHARLWIVPEFVERIHRSRFVLPRFINLPWIHAVVSSFDLIGAMGKISGIAQTIDADLIYCNHMLANPVGAYVGWRLRKPVVFHARNIHVAAFGRFFYEFLARRFWVKAIICNSSASAQLFLKTVPKKTRIIYNSLDLAKYNPEIVSGSFRTIQGVPPEAFVVGYSGRLLPKKGLPVLLHAFRIVADTNPKVHLAILGENDGGTHIDWKSAFSKQVKDWNLQNRVHFLGLHKDVRPILRDFDVLVLPSVEPESFGRVLVEAMALYVPVIASNIGGTSEVVDDGVNGFLIPAGDSSALSEKIQWFIDHPEKKSVFGTAGRKKVEEKFEARKLSDDISQVLMDSISRRVTKTSGPFL